MKYLKRGLIVVHPLLLAVFFVLALYSANLEQVSLSEIVIPLIAALGFTLLLLFVALLIIGLIRKLQKPSNSSQPYQIWDLKKAAIVASIFLVLFFTYGHARNFLSEQAYAGYFIMAMWGILFSCGAYFIVKTHRDLRKLTVVLNIVAVTLIIIPTINIIVNETKTVPQATNVSENIVDLVKPDTLPDIYYIILDAYASSDNLKEFYDYDNSKFTDYLDENGFRIADQSLSNYVMTYLSLASSLNMEYVNYISDIAGAESADRTVLYQMIDNSKVMNSLKSIGYQFIHFSSGWGATDFNEYADINVLCGRMNEFNMVLIQTTMLNPFGKYIIGSDLREKRLCTFSKLADIPVIKEPKFVFAHINCPHPPYVFGVSGETVPETDLAMEGRVWEQKELYLNQLIFISRKVEMLMDEILSKSEVAPIIILQADHGTASTSSEWDDPTTDLLRERTRIFNAYYLPYGGNELIYDSITPVNTFRVIFDFYFDANLKLLNDQCYWSTYEKPYEFMNVTNLVEYN